MSKTSVPLALAAACGLALGASAALGASVNGHSAGFLKTTIQADTSEIMLGRMAEQYGGPGVRRFGRMLIQDHAQHRNQAVALARQVGVDVPNGPSFQANTEAAKLHMLKGRDFDREFANYMANDHQKDIIEFRNEAQRREGPVSALAQRTLPTLRKHLDAAHNLQERE